MPVFSGLGQGRRTVCLAVCVMGPCWKKGRDLLLGGREECSRNKGWSLGCAGRLEGTGLAHCPGTDVLA